MPYDVEMVVQPDPQAPADGALAWALRRFHNAQYVTELAPTIKPPVMVLPAAIEKPVVGAAYVGQGFSVYNKWEKDELSWDVLAWLYNRSSRRPPVGDGRVIVWVRNDVYGVSLDTPTTPAASSSAPGITK